MPVPTDNFDQLCHTVFIANVKTGYDQPTEIPTIQETALGLINQAHVYELPHTVNLSESFILNASTTTDTTTDTTNTSTPLNTTLDRRCYRIRLETIQDSIERNNAYQILVSSINPSALLELPFDRNISGYSTKTRTENQQAALDIPVVLDMCMPEDEEEGQQQQQKNTDPHIMLLISTSEWIRMTGRVRYWRGESHRIKSVMRENILNGLLNDRWKPNHSTTIISSQPLASGSLIATDAINTQASSSPSSSSSSASLPHDIVIPPSQSLVIATRPSAYKLLFQEQQVEYLAGFMKEFGEELSAVSILRGLLNLIRQQLTDEKVLSWTLDRANLTEQKQEVTVGFLDLFAKLGLELIESSGGIDKVHVHGESGMKNEDVSLQSGISVEKKEKKNTDLLWTFGSKIDDRRLEFWIRHVQQSYLPTLKKDSSTAAATSSSSLPLTNSDSKPSHTNNRKQNPVSLAIRKKYLHDRHTIPAGSIQNLTVPPSDGPIGRDKSLVLATSRYSMAHSDSVDSEVFVNRVRKDVVHLAKWASSCGGRLDWFWTWLFSAFHRSRHGTSSSRKAGSEQRLGRSNDENV